MKKLYLLLFLMLTIGFAHGQITCPSNQSAATDVDECSASNVSLPLPGNLPNGFADTITYTLSGGNDAIIIVIYPIVHFNDRQFLRWCYYSYVHD